MRQDRLTPAQRRLYDTIRRMSERDATGVEYWHAVNAVARYQAGALTLRNIDRTVDALIRGGLVSLSESGLFQIVRIV